MGKACMVEECGFERPPDEREIADNFGRVWTSHVANQTWFLIQCRRYFDGDMDRFLVLSVIGDRTLSARHTPPDFKAEDLATLRAQQIQKEPINLQSISDFSGIPRETVRRKLRDLMAIGWVQRDERGNFAATTKAAEDLAPLTELSIKYLAKMKAALCEQCVASTSSGAAGGSGGARSQRSEDQRQAREQHVHTYEKA